MATFYAGQTDYIEALNTLATTAELAGVAGAVSSVAAFAAAAAGSATTATTKAAEASTSATTATTKAAEASTSATTATTQASSATTSSASASAARDLAIAAWAASTAPAETLAAMSQSLHVGTVVKSIIYDTSKDSDGGAWRQRCQDKSWYTETLGGNRWIGQEATIATAWTDAGSTTGAVFQASATAGPLTIGRFYTATSATTATEVFRGVTRAFPAVAGIVAEAARVVIYDLSTGAMWMVFVAAGGALINRAGITSLSAINGTLCIGAIGGASDGQLSTCEFPKDIGRLVIHVTVEDRYITMLSSRNSSNMLLAAVRGTTAIVNRLVNDVAITVLDNAPIDPATGLPVPTIAVATAGGVSVIRDNGTVVNLTASGYTDWAKVGFTADSKLWTHVGNDHRRLGLHKTGIPSANENSLAVLNILSDPVAAGQFPFVKSVNFTRYFTVGKNDPFGAGTDGLFVFKTNPSAFAKSMQAQITNAYNSGWMPGDIRGAYLADTNAETITAPELVTNGTFDTNTSGWASMYQATISNVGQKLRVTAVDGTNPYVRQIVTVVPGKTYRITCDASISPTANTDWKLYVGSTSNIYSVEYANVNLLSAAKVFVTATSTTLNISISGVIVTIGDYADFDNISVKQIDPDRSVKNNGLSINGTLTKTAVASGANLVAYSGFSAANYLEQPYNSQLDFGTGDFCVMGWVNLTTLASASALFQRTLAGGGGGIMGYINASGVIFFYASTDTTNTPILTSAASAITTGTWNLLEFSRVSGVAYVKLNGVVLVSGPYAGTQSYTNAITRFGVTLLGSAPTQGSLALWRISATAPSADQLAHIYRTELPLFQASAQCTIAGTSTAVTALAYDDSTDLLHVGTSWGRTGFKDLLRVDSEATTTGAITSLSAVQGSVLTGGTSAKFYQPALQLRDELARNEEARRALGKVPVFIDFTATASQTAFVLAVGYTIKALYRNGVLMRETTTGVFWTRSNDGYRETATLSVGATVGDWISLMCIRSN